MLRKLTIFLTSFVLVLCTFTRTAQAQRDDDLQLFEGYIAGGLNASQIAGDLLAGYRRMGANIGVGTYIRYTPLLSNSIEISYSMKGSQSSFSNSNPESFRKFIFDYMEVPILLNFHDRDIAIFHVGTSIGRLFRNRIETGLFEQDNTTIKDWEWAVVLGATLKFKERFGVQLRGAFSLLNIHDGAWVNQYNNGNNRPSRARKGGLYHNTVTLRFVYHFIPKSD